MLIVSPIPHRSLLGFAFFWSIAAWVGADERTDGGVLCRSDVASIDTNYPTARVSSCSAIHPTEFLLENLPEDEPINPSPWFGFRIQKLASEGTPQLTLTIRYGGDADHRYVPKLSVDGETWNSIGESQYQILESGDIRFWITLESAVTYVSAQPIIGEKQYHHWWHKYETLWPSAKKHTIGHSVQKRKLYAITTNPKASRVVLIVGRQHPPEVPGAIGMMEFVDQLAVRRAKACAAAPNLECDFFMTHGLVVVPFLNRDGVAEGYWRHNMGGKDLNRDWGEFSEPEPRAVKRLVERLVAQGKSLVVALDFHSTRRDVLYVQLDEDATVPENFARRWYALTQAKGYALDTEYAPRPQGSQGTFKSYFYGRFGIPSITYEVGDLTPPSTTKANARAFADSLVEILGQATGTVRQSPPRCDSHFCHLFDANLASLVALVEAELLSASQFARITQVLAQIRSEADNGSWTPTNNYLDFENRAIEVGGTEIANMHLGRSRQDLHGVVRRMQARDGLLRILNSNLDLQDAILNGAADTQTTVIPMYTHGVPAQPTTYAHVLHGFVTAAGRDHERLMQIFKRLNQSQLGVAVGTTSGYPLDRERIASLLGFERPLINSFDANFLSTADYKLEIAAAVRQIATTVSMFVGLIHSQQRDPHPWIYLAEEQTSGSTSMPQKRNPRLLDRVRTLATDVLGTAHTQTLLAHNVDPGMHDYRRADVLLDLIDKSVLMQLRFVELVRSIQIDEELALHELQRGYSVTSELADTLFRDAGVPFREAHGFAAALTNLARNDGRSLTDLTDEEIHHIYLDALGATLPIPVKELRAAADPKAFIERRVGVGGPQPEEIKRQQASLEMQIRSARHAVDSLTAELLERRENLYAVHAKLRADSH